MSNRLVSARLPWQLIIEEPPLLRSVEETYTVAQWQRITRNLVMLVNRSKIYSRSSSRLGSRGKARLTSRSISYKCHHSSRTISCREYRVSQVPSRSKVWLVRWASDKKILVRTAINFSMRAPVRYQSRTRKNLRRKARRVTSMGQSVPLINLRCSHRLRTVKR